MVLRTLSSDRPCEDFAVRREQSTTGRRSSKLKLTVSKSTAWQNTIGVCLVVDITEAVLTKEGGAEEEIVGICLGTPPAKYVKLII